MLTEFEFYTLIDEYVEARVAMTASNNLALKIVNHLKVLCQGNAIIKDEIECLIDDIAAHRTVNRYTETEACLDKLVKLVSSLYAEFESPFDAAKLVSEGLRIL